MARFKSVSFVYQWIVQAAADLIDLLALDQIPGRLNDLLSIDSRLKSATQSKGAPTTVRI